MGENVLVVGAKPGKIGYFHLDKILDLYVKGDLNAEQIAYTRINSKLFLEALVELKVKGKYRDIEVSLTAFQDLKRAVVSNQPSIAIIASPIEAHYENFLELLNSKNIERILCEKPLAANYKEGEEMVNLAREKGVVLGVNLQLTGIHELLEEIDIYGTDNYGDIINSNLPFHAVWETNGNHPDVIADLLPHVLSLLPSKRYENLRLEDVKVSEDEDTGRIEIKFDNNTIELEKKTNGERYWQFGDHRFTYEDRLEDGKAITTVKYINTVTKNQKEFDLNCDLSEYSIRKLLKARLPKKGIEEIKPLVSGEEALKNLEMVCKVKEVYGSG